MKWVNYHLRWRLLYGIVRLEYSLIHQIKTKETSERIVTIKMKVCRQEYEEFVFKW